MRTLWNRIDGKPREELNDVILEYAYKLISKDVTILYRVAAHARMHLQKAQEFQNDLPPQAFRAFLHCVNPDISDQINFLIQVEAEMFFEELEKADFNIFAPGLHSPSYMVLPYRVFTAARAKKFTLK